MRGLVSTIYVRPQPADFSIRWCYFWTFKPGPLDRVDGTISASLLTTPNLKPRLQLGLSNQ